MVRMLCLIATTVFASLHGEEEPEDLGAGRRGKASTIRRGGSFGGGAALSTSGFFRFQGNHEEGDEFEAEDLGEAIHRPAPRVHQAGDAYAELGEGVGVELTALARDGKFSEEGLKSVIALINRAREVSKLNCSKSAPRVSGVRNNTPKAMPSSSSDPGAPARWVYCSPTACRRHPSEDCCSQTVTYQATTLTSPTATGPLVS